MKLKNIKNRRATFIFCIMSILPLLCSAQRKNALIQMEISPSVRLATFDGYEGKDVGFGGTMKFMLIDNSLSKKGIEKSVKPFLTLAFDYGSYSEKRKDQGYGISGVYNYKSFLLSSGTGILVQKFFFELKLGAGVIYDEPCISLGAEAGFFSKNFTFSAFHTSTSDIIWGDVSRIYGLKVGYRLNLNKKE